MVAIGGNVLARLLDREDDHELMIDVDLPAPHILPFVIARGEAQCLDHRLHRMIVGVACAVADMDQHFGPF